MQKVFFGSMEYLDIVNQQDEIVSKEERSLAHSKHLLHRSVHIIIANTKGEILLQLRKSTKKQYPLYWSSSVGGHVQSGETPNEAAKKELKEELGVSIPLEFVGKFIINDEVEYEMVHTFFSKSDGPFSFLVEEMEKATFFPVENLKKGGSEILMTPHCRQALNLIMKKYFG